MFATRFLPEASQSIFFSAEVGKHLPAAPHRSPRLDSAHHRSSPSPSARHRPPSGPPKTDSCRAAFLQAVTASAPSYTSGPRVPARLLAHAKRRRSRSGCRRDSAPGAGQPYPSFQTSPWRSGRRHLGRAGRRERTAPASLSWEKRRERTLGGGGGRGAGLPQPRARRLLPEEALDVLLAVAQVAPSVQGGVGDQQQPPRAPHTAL